MMPLETLVALLLILTVAAIFSPIGLGGGILFVPILHYLLGFSMENSMIGSLCLVWMVSLGSMIAHHSAGQDDVESAKLGIMMYVPSAIIGSIIGIFLVNRVSDFSIKILVVILMLFILYNSIRPNKNAKTISKNNPNSSYGIGCGVGGLSAGLLGIGGGAVMVMLSKSYAGLGSHSAAGNSYSVEVIGVPVALILHIFASGHAPEISNLGIYIQIFLIMFTVALTAWTGARIGMKFLPEKAINFAYLSIVSIGLLSYLNDIIVNFL